jgi:hypothetical protein
MMGRVIAAWPSFALIDSYELLMRQVRRAASANERGAASHALKTAQQPAAAVRPATSPKLEGTQTTVMGPCRQAWQGRQSSWQGG